jgi:hypothetical protein
MHMTWKNWGDHPIVVGVGICGVLIGLVYTVYDHHFKSDASDPTPSLQPNSSPGNQPTSSLSSLPEYRSLEGKWLIVEKVKPEHGNWDVIWEYDAKVSNKVLMMRGRKTRVNGREPSKGEIMAISTYRMDIEDFNAKGDFEETNYRKEILRGLVKISFAKNLKSFNGTLYQGNQEIASMTGNKQ